jgi:hypothetical protein
MCRSQEKNFTRRYCCPLIASEAYQPCSLLMNAILSVDEPNHCMHGSAMQVVIGHIAFKGEMANFDLSYLRHR